MVKSEGELRFLDELVNNFEYDVLHAWEVESLHCHFHTLGDLHSQVEFIFVVILNAKHKVEFHVVGLFSVFLEQMDQVIQDVVWEALDVFYDEYYWPHLLWVLTPQYVIHPVE